MICDERVTGKKRQKNQRNQVV